MTKVITSIYDHKVNNYDTVNVTVNLEIAKRDLSAALKINKEAVISIYPEDFDLFVIGYLNTDSGEITAVHEFVCNLSQLADKEA